MTKNKNVVRDETPAPYNLGDDNNIIARAIAILQQRMASGPILQSPRDVKDYLQLTLAPLEYESFTVVFLTSQHHVITTEELFRGTLNQTSVYPREVVKRALFHNAGAVILCHNHPSGLAEPSRADEFLTQSLKSALLLVDVRVIDHIVVAASGTVSFAERGLI